jgi:hypothetical protein
MERINHIAEAFAHLASLGVAHHRVQHNLMGGSEDCGARGVRGLWGERDQRTVGREGPEDCGARGVKGLWAERDQRTVRREGPEDCEE